jgi:subtilisin family serine protease
VDVFAPGVRIYSTVPGGNTYAALDGTSMASPVVAGVAALIKSYYPNLSPEQIKYAIENSTSKITEQATIPGSDRRALLSELSVTGGIVNAYEAIRLADQLSTGKGNMAPGGTPAPSKKEKEKKAF